MIKNPLLSGMQRVEAKIDNYRLRARRFYYRVMLSRHDCPRCGGQLFSTGPSRAQCVSCEMTLDPTVHFQVSPCCGAKLVHKMLHYACGKCGRTVPSRFLFDEIAFDNNYFALKMQESRAHRRQRRREVAAMLAAARSEELQITAVEDLSLPSGLEKDLNDFVESAPTVMLLMDFTGESEFHMEQYRRFILSRLSDCFLRFTAFPPLCPNPRMDRTRRFTTLIFMEQAREVWLEQQGTEILVAPYEAHN
jgi:ribosomal protein S27AE